MNDTTFTGYILDRHRAADLARENELMVAHRERGATAERPHARPLAAWFRAARSSAATDRAPSDSRATTNRAARDGGPRAAAVA